VSPTIAIAGKGGVGKTTLSALIVQWLFAAQMTPVLAVDADSNANLHEVLGVDYQATVGGIREDARQAAKEMAGISKQEFLDLRVQESIVEQIGYDLIVMGRPEGPGCYCFANNVLRDVIQRIADNYAYLVIDNEAGLEHLSRRTLLSVDHLIIVSDCSVRGVRTAARIARLAEEMGTPVKHRGLIINRVPGGVLPDGVKVEAEATGLPVLAIIPFDSWVARMDGDGGAVGTIPTNASARTAINRLLADLLDKAPAYA
jgi:CO dehydrogenase maturation factor